MFGKKKKINVQQDQVTEEGNAKRVIAEIAALKDRYEKLSVADLVRQKLQGITVNTSLIDEMSHEERIDFCEKANDVFKNPSFKRVIDFLISLQVDTTVKRAANMEEVLFGRATINGLSLVREEFERLANLAEEERDKPRKMSKEEKQEIV